MKKYLTLSLLFFMATQSLSILSKSNDFWEQYSDKFFQKINSQEVKEYYTKFYADPNTIDWKASAGVGVLGAATTNSLFRLFVKPVRHLKVLAVPLIGVSLITSAYLESEQVSKSTTDTTTENQQMMKPNAPLETNQNKEIE